MITVYVSIGNSDDKLSQAEWAAFVYETSIVAESAQHMHGRWVSPSAYAYQNACWCVEVIPEHVGVLKAALARLAAKYRQDSIAWAEAETAFIGPAS